MKIRSYCGCRYEHPQHECANATQGHLILSFPLFRPFKGWYLPRSHRARVRREAKRNASPSGGEHGRVRIVLRGCSSAGRAPALHAGGHRFESGHLHQNLVNRIGRFEILVDCRGERLDSSCKATMCACSAASATEEWMQAGQATKGPRWMPRHQVPKKDAATCDKRRGVGSER